MSFFFTENRSSNDQKQASLLQLSALFLLLYSIILTLAPAVRLHSWSVAYRWNHWIGFAVWLAGVWVVYSQLKHWLPDHDPFLFPITSLLMGWGLLTIWRLDAAMGARQTLWLAISMLVFAGGLRINHLLVFLRRYKYLWLTAGLLLTGLTFLFGTYPGGFGPRLWLGCCGAYLQPSEPLKLLMIVYLAAYLADRILIQFGLMEMLTPTLLMIGAALALLVAQRDLGTASLFILIYTAVIYMASGRRRMLVISLLILLTAGLIGYQLFDVVRIRVDAWINPWLDPSGRSYQIVQSLMAVASGGFFGHGPGLGSPGVVPVAHSDFIFASIAEETGLLGSIGLLAIYALLVSRGFRAALYASNNYRRYLAAGITTYLIVQAILIIGGNLRLLPLTGVTLPFVSYGGSSLLTASISLLILTLTTSHSEEEPAPLPNPTPYLFTSGALLLGLLALALAAGWWGIIRNEDLLARAENPRRVIADRFVSRGALLDRNNNPIASTTGKAGEFTRKYEYPPLSNSTGYNSPLYGQAGLEAGLDDYLRGIRGNPASLIWSDDLIYGQPPPGLNVRLTIDLETQKQADDLLAGHKGALVLLNARSGEILAIASHPSFDANQLDASWNDLTQDPNAPLLNRATQGLYPPGPAIGPFLLALNNVRGNKITLPGSLFFTDKSIKYPCAVNPQLPLTTAGVVASGCPAPLVQIGEAVGKETLENLFTSLGFFETPSLPLQQASPPKEDISQYDLAAIGQENLTVTPLQMALAAAALSNDGMRPTPQIASAVLTPQQGWLVLPQDPGQETVLTEEAAATALSLAGDNGSYWQTVALARSGDEELTWYVGGTLPEWKGTPLAIAILLEEGNPDLAQTIGQTLFREINP